MSVASAGALIGGVGGELMSRGDRKEAERRRRQALAVLEQLNPETGEVAPEMRQSMANAVDYLMGLYGEGGLDPQAEAALAEAQASNAARERMGRGAIVQNAAMRGVGGSGVDIAAQLANQQGAANRNAATGTQVAADARARAIQSLMGGANLAGNVRGQDSALAQFNAAQRTRKAGLLSGAYGDAASAADEEANRRRYDWGQLGGYAGSYLQGGGGR